MRPADHFVLVIPPLAHCPSASSSSLTRLSVGFSCEWGLVVKDNRELGRQFKEKLNGQGFSGGVIGGGSWVKIHFQVWCSKFTSEDTDVRVLRSLLDVCLLISRGTALDRTRSELPFCGVTATPLKTRARKFVRSRCFLPGFQGLIRWSFSVSRNVVLWTVLRARTLSVFPPEFWQFWCVVLQGMRARESGTRCVCSLSEWFRGGQFGLFVSW